MRGMSSEKAWNVLKKNNLTNPALIEMTSQAQEKQTNLRKNSPPKGYSGIDGARKMLNDMIWTSMSKYDEEIQRCTAYYASQCSQMELCRGQISQSNEVAANSRKLILDAQSCINKCEVDIPTRKLELKMHNEKCDADIAKMYARLKVIEADIEVMNVILKMTDCKESMFAQIKQLALLHCKDPCSKKSFVTFDHDVLKKQMSQLQSSESLKIIQESFADLFQGVESLQATELLQAPVINKTKFNNPPVPRTEIPEDPCTDPDSGAPSAADKNAAKCTITASPQCPKLQERFLLIQSGIKDERDALLEDIASMKEHCKEVRETLERQIQDDEDLLSECETKLAFATEKEATAGEQARMTNTKHEQLNKDLKTQMKTCSNNYINFETEICALKRIRGELYKMKGSGHSAFFQDCEVSKWEPEECSQECKRVNEPDGEQRLTRNVMTHPDGGAKCLPLEAVRKCNLQPCPVDCKLEAWTGWSKCSAECGGGAQQRLREVQRAEAFGGKPCGAVSETKACNAQACEKDCELSRWTKWSTCSKDCDGGTRKRMKYVKVEPEGAGTCPDKWSVKRLQYKKCNMVRCQTPLEDLPLACNRSIDVMLLLDGSGSLGKKGWAAEIAAAQLFTDAFARSGKGNMAVILYSGPKTWSGVSKCTGKSKDKVDPEACGIKMVTHFTEDIKKVKQLITGLEWPQGSTLTSLALMTAKTELALGRKASLSNV